MEDTYISFETAKLSRSKGFNSITKESIRAMNDTRNNETIFFDYYLDNTEKVEFRKCGTNSNHFFGLESDYAGTLSEENKYKWYLAPTQSILQKWLREKHGLILLVYFNEGEVNKWEYHIIGRKPFVFGNSYEEALEAGLKEGLKLI